VPRPREQNFDLETKTAVSRTTRLLSSTFYYSDAENYFEKLNDALVSCYAGYFIEDTTEI